MSWFKSGQEVFIELDSANAVKQAVVVERQTKSVVYTVRLENGNLISVNAGRIKPAS